MQLFGRTARAAVVVKASLSLGIAIGLGSVTTFAYWTASASVEIGAMESGDLDVTLNGELAGIANLDGTLTTATWDASNLLPGERIAFDVTVTNAGSTPMDIEYTVGSYFVGPYAPAVRAMYHRGGSATNAPLNPSSNANLTDVNAQTMRRGSCGGTDIHGGWQLGISTDPLAPTMIETPARTLAHGASEQYCVVMAFDHNQASWNTTAYRNAGGSFVLVIRGVQAGA